MILGLHGQTHTHLLKSFQPKWQCLEFHHPGMTAVLTPRLLEVTSTTQSQPVARKVRAVWLLLMSTVRDKDLVYLWRQRRRNLIIFRAAWSCFLVSKLLLKKPKHYRHKKGSIKLIAQTLRSVLIYRLGDFQLNGLCHTSNCEAHAAPAVTLPCLCFLCLSQRLLHLRLAIPQ